MMNLNISDDDYNEIITEIGYPVLTMDDDETDIEMIKEQIIKLCILPSVREYFRWFPIITQAEYSVSSTFTIDFPDNETFAVSHSSLNTLGSSLSGSQTGNHLINSRYYSSSSGGGSKYGPYSYNMGRARYTERIETQSLIDSNKSFRVNVNKASRQVTGYTNISGKLLVDWAKYSENYSDIPFSDLSLVIKLSTSYVLRKFGMIRGMQDSSTPNQFNYNLMLSESEKLKEEVMDYFKKRSKVVIQRG